MLVVKEIERRLIEKEYSTYVGVKHRSLKALRENIFRELSSSEYFLFIDFKREPTMETAQDGTVRLFHRGSLFSHQELALASFLELEAVGFQQAGVRREGVLEAMQLNCFQFEDVSELPDLVMKQIEAMGWDSHWKAQLTLERSETEPGSSPEDSRRIYHIQVRNAHQRKPAINCSAFLHKIKKLGSDDTIPFQKFELKWAGTKIPFVTIMPSEYRSFDAFYITRDEPTTLKWLDFSYTDTKEVCPDVTDAGEYEIIYVVTSFNFPAMYGRFRLLLKESWDEISTLTLIECGMMRPHEPY